MKNYEYLLLAMIICVSCADKNKLKCIDGKIYRQLNSKVWIAHRDIDGTRSECKTVEIKEERRRTRYERN